MDKPEKDMPNKANPEKGKPEIDIHKSDKDEVPKLYSNPNDLKNLLQDLEDYESWGADSNNYNSTTQDRITPEAPDEKPASKKVTKAAPMAVPGHKQVYSNGAWSQPTAPKPKPAVATPPVTNQPTGQPTPPMPNMPNAPKAPEPQLGDSKEPGPNHIEQLKHENVGGAIDALSKVLKSVEPPQPKGVPGQPQAGHPQPGHQTPPMQAPHTLAATLKNIILKVAKDSKHPDKETTGVVDEPNDFMQDDSALDVKEVDDLLEDTNAYMEYLGLSDADEKPKGSKKK